MSHHFHTFEFGKICSPTEFDVKYFEAEAKIYTKYLLDAFCKYTSTFGVNASKYLLDVLQHLHQIFLDAFPIPMCRCWSSTRYMSMFLCMFLFVQVCVVYTMIVHK